MTDNDVLGFLETIDTDHLGNMIAYQALHANGIYIEVEKARKIATMLPQILISELLRKKLLDASAMFKFYEANVLK